MRAKIIRIERFNAAHRLHNPKWSEEKNAEFYGRCNYKNFHGHNYTLELHVTGEVDPESGYVMDAKKLSDITKELVIERFDHKNLSLDCPEFAELIPTAENISMVIYNILKPVLGPQKELQIILHETEKNIVVFPV